MAKRTYVYNGDAPVVLPDFAIEVEPGATVEVDGEINHPDFVAKGKGGAKAEES